MSLYWWETGAAARRRAATFPALFISFWIGFWDSVPDGSTTETNKGLETLCSSHNVMVSASKTQEGWFWWTEWQKRKKTRSFTHISGSTQNFSTICSPVLPGVRACDSWFNCRRVNYNLLTMGVKTEDKMQVDNMQMFGHAHIVQVLFS